MLRYWEAVSRDGIGAFKKACGNARHTRLLSLLVAHPNEEAADFTMTLDEDAACSVWT